MNRASRRDLQKILEKENAKRPVVLTMIPASAWPAKPYDPSRVEVWISQKYLVQVFNEDGGIVRLSVNRTMPRLNGGWMENITWDELQDIKRDIGRGDSYAVEVYPRDGDVVNVANMRHLWILPEPLTVGWFKGGEIVSMVFMIAGPVNDTILAALRIEAKKYDAEVIVSDHIFSPCGLVVGVDPASEITGAWINEAAEIPKELFMEFEIPERVDEGYGIPYRDRKVMHPWSRRKKR